MDPVLSINNSHNNKNNNQFSKRNYTNITNNNTIIINNNTTNRNNTNRSKNQSNNFTSHLKTYRQDNDETTADNTSFLQTNALKTTTRSEHDENQNINELIYMKDLYHNLIKRLAKIMFNEKADEIFKNKNAQYIENLICDKISNFKEE